MEVVLQVQLSVVGWRQLDIGLDVVAVEVGVDLAVAAVVTGDGAGGDGGGGWGGSGGGEDFFLPHFLRGGRGI